MYHLLHQAAFFIHICAGCVALIAFWIPFVTRKGNKKHRNYGQFFVNIMYLVACSGFVMSLLVLADPVAVRFPEGNGGFDSADNFVFQNRVSASFLFMLSILVIVFLRQSILVLKVKSQRDKLKTTSHIVLLIFLALLGLTLGLIGLTQDIILFDIFAFLSIVTSLRCLHYIYKAKIKEREWIVAHLGNITGAGIATYTAFFSFGGRRLFDEILMAELQILPWILPGVVGGFAISYMDRKYSKQFRVLDLSPESSSQQDKQELTRPKNACVE